ncbi:hypothetical protein GMSM_34270 [Geomonas sp. Red276]
MKGLTAETAAGIGSRALARVRAEHTYMHRARQFQQIFSGRDLKIMPSPL